ncbi:MAG: hypothetical protein RL529_597, partial [Actinomycetota bacterium]
VQPVYRSGSSGTSENFTNYLAQIAQSGWVKNGTFASANTVVGTSAATSTVLVTTVKSTAGAFGYADLSDVTAAKLTYASIKNGAGQFVKPDVRTAKAHCQGVPCSSASRFKRCRNLRLQGSSSWRLPVVTNLLRNRLQER